MMHHCSEDLDALSDQSIFNEQHEPVAGPSNYGTLGLAAAFPDAIGHAAIMMPLNANSCSMHCSKANIPQYRSLPLPQ